MRKSLLSMLFLAFSICISAQSRYVIDGEGFGNYNLKNKTFFLAPADSDVNINDIEFQTYASYVTAILEFEGAVKAKDIENADLCILFRYDITDKTHVETIPVPIRGIVGSTSRTYTNTSTNKNTYGSIYGNAYNSSTTTYTTPTYGTVGYSSVDQTVEDYLRVLDIYAYDNNNVDNPTMLWKANLRSIGSSNSLLKVFPMLCLSAANQGLGKKMSYSVAVYEDAEWAQLFLNAVDNNDTVNIYRKDLSSGVRLRYICREDNRLTIIYSFSENASVELPKTIHVEADGQKYPLIGVNNGKITKRVRAPHNDVKYHMLHFQAVPEKCHTISICEGGILNMENIEIK